MSSDINHLCFCRMWCLVVLCQSLNERLRRRKLKYRVKLAWMYLPIWSSFQIFHYHVLPLMEAMFVSFPSHPKQHLDGWSSKIPVLRPIFISVLVALLECSGMHGSATKSTVMILMKWFESVISSDLDVGYLLCFVCLFLFGAAS